MGIRASVKLDGRSTLKLSDISNLREFDDCVGVGCYPVDIHDPITEKSPFSKNKWNLPNTGRLFYYLNKI